MDGTVGLSLQLASASTALRGRLNLQGGEILSLRVGQSLGKNRYEVAIRGATLTVRSSIPLPSGMLLHAKVVFTGARIELKILEPATAATASLRAQGTLPPAARSAMAHDPVTVLIQAMQRTGLPVTTSSMNAIAAMLPPERRNDPAYVRLATVLYDKHLHVDPERLEELYLTINERPRGDTGGGPGSQRRPTAADRSVSCTAYAPPSRADTANSASRAAGMSAIGAASFRIAA